MKRNSNIELLRRLCMLMVVILHFNNNGANNGIVNMPSVLTPSLQWGFLVQSLCIVAVNCFVLISGYFGIKLKWRSVGRFYWQCFIIGLASYVAYLWLTPDSFQWRLLLERLLAFTHNGWWFVVTYLGLMLLSPLFNSAAEYLDRKQMLIALGGFAVVIGYLGWYQQLEALNSGCSLLNFAFLYLIGRYIGKHISLDRLRRWRWLWLGGYLAACLSLYALIQLRYAYSLEMPYPFDYSHPLVITAAVMLLLFFLTWDFYSSTVNLLASSVFSAYLLQESTYFGHQWLYPWMEQMFTFVPDGYRLLSLLGVSIVFVLLSIAVDKMLVQMPKHFVFRD